jgi:hypothetical protein
MTAAGGCVARVLKRGSRSSDSDRPAVDGKGVCGELECRRNYRSSGVNKIDEVKGIDN